MTTKEIAKFFSGVAAWEAIGHTALAFSNELPLTLLGITITPNLNALAVFVAAPLSIFLAWYAWGTGKLPKPMSPLGN
ncbi:MAG: hypothetical protein HYX68_11130 [Planctomycetes bacterium]|jgi:hypothetical protein|nr:hypothetical protein [Planctomycetota bacterium]